MVHRKMGRGLTWPVGLVVMAAGMLWLSGCKDKAQSGCATGCCGGKGHVLAAPLTPRLGFTLAEEYASPDGMTIGPDGSIYLSINGAGKDFAFAHPSKILRITQEDELEEVVDLPVHPVTGKVSPLGLVFGPDGHLYVSDNQGFAGGDHASRVLRVVMKNGQADRVEVVVEGFQTANGIAVKDDYIYVNESSLDVTVKPMVSGVYRFAVSELDAAAPVKVTGLSDPHFFLKIETDYPNDLMKVGANGIDFDSKGNMYVCNFGEAEVKKVTFKDDGAINTVETLCRGDKIESADGLHVDAEDNLWVADFMGNAIFRICSTCGVVSLAAKNGPGDGADGSLDAPSECIRRGDKVYVSNIDITYGPNTADDIQTVSILDLK